MDAIIDWGTDLIPRGENVDLNIGLESFNPDMNQRPSTTANDAMLNFKPVNIIVENGLFYATIYVCDSFDGSQTSQKLAIWLASLKDTDYVHLTLSSLLYEVPLPSLLGLMSAIASTKAKIDIHLDQIVADGLAYFYLLADKITKGTEGALFVPSYVDQREEDKSGPWKAVHDFYMWVVDEAITKGLLTADEASKLHRGSHVIIPDDRFVKNV